MNFKKSAIFEREREVFVKAKEYDINNDIVLPEAAEVWFLNNVS